MNLKINLLECLMDNKLIEICYKKYNKEIALSWDEIAKIYTNSSGEALRSKFKKYRKSIGDIDKNIITEETENIPNYKSTNELKSDGSQISDKLLQMSSEESKDPNFILESHGYSPEAFELINAKNSIWNVNTKENGIKTLYSSKISVRPRTELLLNEVNLEKILDNLIKNYSIPSHKHIKYNPSLNGDLLILNMADLHFGLKSYMETSNNEYDDVIASDRFLYIINDVLNRIKYKTINKIILLNLGDICNFDTPYMTTKGTPQNDHSGTYYSMFTKVSNLLITAIDSLSSIAPIEVWNCNSNHDKYTTFGIFQVLNAWYKDNDNVWIDIGTLDRKYIRHGKTLIGIAHDINEKIAYKTIHNEAKEYISDCNYLYWFVAHLHKTMVIDDYGVEIRRLPTVSGSSDWTYQQGYTGTIKKSQSFIISKDYGIIDIMNTVIKN
jgi:hypothetical protein